MHNLYKIRFYAFEFISCKISVDAVSLLYSKLLLAKLCRFTFGAALLLLLHSIGSLLAYVAVLLVSSVCGLLRVCCRVLDSNSRGRRFEAHT